MFTERLKAENGLKRIFQLVKGFSHYGFTFYARVDIKLTWVRSMFRLHCKFGMHKCKRDYN